MMKRSGIGSSNLAPLGTMMSFARSAFGVLAIPLKVRFSSSVLLISKEPNDFCRAVIALQMQNRQLRRSLKNRLSAVYLVYT